MKTEETYSMQRIAQILGGKMTGNVNPKIRFISIDSRFLQLPHQSIFFALVGKRHDAHEYIEDLYRKGVRAFVVSKPVNPENRFPKASFILVSNTLLALQTLATNHRKQFKYPITGITGSNGKTIVKEWLHQVLQKKFKIVRNPKSYNSQVGVPLSVWGLHPKANLGIFEAGISQPGEMCRLQEIIQPNIGVFTHLGDAHSENFSGKEELLYEKIKLFSSCHTIVYCADDALLEKTFAENTKHNCRQMTWARRRKAFCRITDERKTANFTHIAYQIGENKNSFRVPFVDKASINNAITTFVTALALGISEDDVKKEIMNLEPIAMRLEIKEGLNHCTLINDYYNSDLGSLEIAIDFMEAQKAGKKKCLILSDIYQSGIPDKELYKMVAGLLNRKQIDCMMGIGKRISAHAHLFQKNSFFYPSTEVFLQKYKRSSFKNELVLMKGARNFHFERISKALQAKAHRTVMEVDLNAMVHNLNHFKSLLQPKTKLAVMVKAFSYGSGLVETANLLQFHQVDYLAVAIADEGVELRNADIRTPIMVMNPEPNSFEMMIEYRLEPEIYNLKVFCEFKNTLRKYGIKNYPIHLKLDTGMHRMGFMQEDLNDLIPLLKDDDCYVKSVFSHLAAADDSAHDAYTQQQIHKFKSMSSSLQKALPYSITRHLLNSAGIERFPEAQFEMVRLGIGLHGISTQKSNKLLNVTSLKTSISQIKQIKKGESLGYARKCILKEDTKIGIIPIGYADGFNRKLSNGVGHVLVNGKKCPILGNICMDMSIINLSKTEANEGDTVVIFGNNYPVSEIAKQLETIPYEVLTSVSRRVKRIYLQE